MCAESYILYILSIMTSVIKEEPTCYLRMVGAGNRMAGYDLHVEQRIL